MKGPQITKLGGASTEQHIEGVEDGVVQQPNTPVGVTSLKKKRVEKILTEGPGQAGEKKDKK